MQSIYQSRSISDFRSCKKFDKYSDEALKKYNEWLIEKSCDENMSKSKQWDGKYVNFDPINSHFHRSLLDRSNWHLDSRCEAKDLINIVKKKIEHGEALTLENLERWNSKDLEEEYNIRTTKSQANRFLCEMTKCSFIIENMYKGGDVDDCCVCLVGASNALKNLDNGGDIHSFFKSPTDFAVKYGHLHLHDDLSQMGINTTRLICPNSFNRKIDEPYPIWKLFPDIFEATNQNLRTQDQIVSFRCNIKRKEDGRTLDAADFEFKYRLLYALRLIMIILFNRVEIDNYYRTGSFNIRFFKKDEGSESKKHGQPGELDTSKIPLLVLIYLTDNFE